MTRGRFQESNNFRFGPNCFGQRCLARTRRGMTYQRPANLSVGLRTTAVGHKDIRENLDILRIDFIKKPISVVLMIKSPQSNAFRKAHDTSHAIAEARALFWQ